MAALPHSRYDASYLTRRFRTVVVRGSSGDDWHLQIRHLPSPRGRAVFHTGISGVRQHRTMINQSESSRRFDRVRSEAEAGMKLCRFAVLSGGMYEYHYVHDRTETGGFLVFFFA